MLDRWIKWKLSSQAKLKQHVKHEYNEPSVKLNMHHSVLRYRCYNEEHKNGSMVSLTLVVFKVTVAMAAVVVGVLEQ